LTVALLLAACEREPRSPPPPGVPPVAAPEALAGVDLAVTVGEELSLDAGASVGETFVWTLDDGRELAGPQVSVRFDAPGHHGVVLTARGEDGREDTDQLVVTATWPLLPEAPRTARALDLDAANVYVPMPDFDLLAIVDRATSRVSHAATCSRPRTVSVGAAGVWVACEGDEVALHRTDGELQLQVALPHGSRPYGVVADGDGAWLTLTGAGAVAHITSSGAVTQFAVGPDARGLATVGRDVFVSRWRSPDDGGVLWRLDRSGILQETLRLEVDPGPDSDTNTRGVPSLLSPVVARPDGRVLVIGGLKSNTERGEYLEGQPFTHDTTTRADARQLSLVVDEGAVGAELAPLVFDDRDQVVGLAFSPGGDWLYALHLGAEVVDVVDAYTLRRSGAAAPLGHGPDALVVDGDALWVSAPLSRTVTRFDLARPELPAVVEVVGLLPPGGEVRPADELLGEVVFTSTADRRMSAGGYAACATCHPEGQADGRTWDFTQRGEGLRNTTSLLGGGGLAPLHWSANFDEVQDFENDIRDAMGGTGFLSDADFAATSDTLGATKEGLSPELDALAVYLRSLDRPPASPWRDPDGGPSEAALRGGVLFLDPLVGCAGCHQGAQWTDSGFVGPGEPLLHDVGTLGPGSGLRRGGPLTGLDTPTLRGVWATAPYLHDGSAQDLRAVLVDRNPADLHGVTSHLTSEQLDDLVAFLSNLE